MPTVDIAIIAVLLLPALVGAMYGFLNILFSLAAWILALLVSIQFGPHLSPALEPWVENSFLREILGFAGVFLAGLVLLTLIGYFIVKLLGRAGLTAADRMLGFVFGLGLGGGIIAVVVFVSGFTALPRQPWWQDSLLLPPFEQIAGWGKRYLPENVIENHGYAPGPVESGRSG
jgi:membrane protein required for colicin V production